MTNFTPTLIAYSAIWLVLGLYHAYQLAKAVRLEEKIRELSK